MQWGSNFTLTTICRLAIFCVLVADVIYYAITNIPNWEGK